MEDGMKPILLAAGITLLAFSLQAEEAVRSVVVKPVLTTDVTASGQPIALPTKNAQLIVSTYEIAPGAILPEHKHPFSRYAYVLAGTLRVSNTETGKSDVYNIGDFITEAVGQWHQGENIGTNTAKLLVIDHVEKGESNVVLKK
jgi:quercetin dioxygenase-like cupin family protein